MYIDGIAIKRAETFGALMRVPDPLGHGCLSLRIFRCCPPAFFDWSGLFRPKGDETLISEGGGSNKTRWCTAEIAGIFPDRGNERLNRHETADQLPINDGTEPVFPISRPRIG